MLHGIDISNYQRGLRIADIQADFVIVKASEGVGYADPSAKDLAHQTLQSGRRLGMYHFAHPGKNTAQAEAEWFLKIVQPYIGKAILAAREAETIMDFIHCARTAVDTIVRLPRFSMATATRLLTLARPDRAVSINGASKAGLARLTGRTQYWISEPRNYGMLLRWVYAQRWYQSPVPADAGEASLWQARAALLDVLAYDNSSPLTQA